MSACADGTPFDPPTEHSRVEIIVDIMCLYMKDVEALKDLKVLAVWTESMTNDVFFSFLSCSNRLRNMGFGQDLTAGIGADTLFFKQLVCHCRDFLLCRI